MDSSDHPPPFDSLGPLDSLLETELADPAPVAAIPDSPKTSSAESVLNERIFSSVSSIEQQLAKRLSPIGAQLASLYSSSQRTDQAILETAQQLESLQRALESLADSIPDIRPLTQAMKHLSERVEALSSRMHIDFAEPLSALRELLFDAEESHGTKLDALEERLTSFLALQEELAAEVIKIEQTVAERLPETNSPTNGIFLGLILFVLMANFALSIWSVHVWLQAIR